MDTIAADIEKDFNSYTNLNAKRNVLGSRETTFRIGGAFEYFLEPQSVSELASTLSWLKSKNQKYRILGAGSNLLVNSLGVQGWTLRLGREFRSLEKISTDVFRVGAAFSLTGLSRQLSQAGYSGLEFAAGIPASIGGAVRMNAGAHAGEMSAVILAVEGFNSDGEELRVSNSELNFDYRTCFLPKEFFVTSVDLKLISADPTSIMLNLTKNLNYRKNTQPLTSPSAGSIFRNIGVAKHESAGSIIETLGLKGKADGGAEISVLHANWIINPLKKALSSEVVSLIEVCKSEALKNLSVTLQTEVVMW